MNDLAGFEEYASGADDDELGALSDLISRARSKGRRGGGQRRLAPPGIPMAGAAPRMATKRTVLGLGTVIFDATSGTSLSIEVEPQRGFQPERLTAALARSGAAGLLVSVTDIRVGDVQQIPASAGCPIEMFAPDATDADIDLTAATPGMKILVTLRVSAAPAGADTVTVNLGFFGKVIGQ